MHVYKKKYGLVTVMVLMFSVFGLTACDDDSAITDAAQELSDGAEDAVESMDPDRSAGEKIGEAVEDAGEKVQDAAE